jgi:hypothetical protein
MATRLIIVLTLISFYVGTVIAGTFSVAASARDPGVAHLISYEILGPRNHPFPIVYLSTRYFHTTLGEFVVVLPKTRFDVVSAYTQARFARPDCPGEPPIGDIWYTVKITEHNKKRTRACVLPQASACEYLLGVAKLEGMDWTRKELQPIRDFGLEAKCGVFPVR